MMQYNKNFIGQKAKELGFVRDTLEKVWRLADVLKFFETDDILSECLALKGGTAINLTIFDLPRLSVDIDLDYSQNTDRERMIANRKIITERIGKYMTANDYVLSTKSKNFHALDSFVYEYKNCGGMKDNLKIEINYILRCHILPAMRRSVKLPWLDSDLTVLSVAPLEIFSSKIVALLNRTAPRDLYDIHNMLKFGLFDESEQDMLRKCIMFYSCVGSDSVPTDFIFENIKNMPQNKIKTALLPVLRGGEFFDLKAVQNEVISYLNNLLIPTKDEIEFRNAFINGMYKPELMFNDEIANCLLNHPMALWKCSHQIENKRSIGNTHKKHHNEPER